MKRKIPPDAFEYYVGLGPDRSYQAVAQHFDVSKRAVQDCANREGWVGRLEKIEADSRAQSDKQLTETLNEIRARHLKTLRAMTGRALEAIKGHQLSSCWEGMRAAEMAIKLERLIVGDPTDRNAVSVEDVVRRESRRWLTSIDADDGAEAGRADPDDEDSKQAPDDAVE